ncbi:MAG TPA: hypothetical protein DCR97_03960 [Deltaproteobacteria bacterium]|nr:hypothetical protein [Deltaproteobacteria bacterium]
MTIHKLLLWFSYGAFAITGLVMVILGFLFFFSTIGSSLSGTSMFTQLLFGIILLVTGGGLLSSAFVESYRRFRHRS